MTRHTESNRHITNREIWKQGVASKAIVIGEEKGFLVKLLAGPKFGKKLVTIVKQPGDRHPVLTSTQSTVYEEHPRGVLSDRYYPRGQIDGYDVHEAVDVLKKNEY